MGVATARVIVTPRVSADRHNDADLIADLVLTICPAVVDHDVLTLDKASYVQSLAKDGDKLRIDSGRTAAEESDHRQPTLLRARRERPSRTRSHSSNEIAPAHELPQPRSII